jgi:hypothetical protein
MSTATIRMVQPTAATTADAYRLNLLGRFNARIQKMAKATMGFIKNNPVKSLFSKVWKFLSTLFHRGTSVISKVYSKVTKYVPGPILAARLFFIPSFMRLLFSLTIKAFYYLSEVPVLTARVLTWPIGLFGNRGKKVRNTIVRYVDTACAFTQENISGVVLWVAKGYNRLSRTVAFGIMIGVMNGVVAGSILLATTGNIVVAVMAGIIIAGLDNHELPAIVSAIRNRSARTSWFHVLTMDLTAFAVQEYVPEGMTFEDWSETVESDAKTAKANNGIVDRDSALAAAMTGGPTKSRNGQQHNKGPKTHN